MLMETRFNFYTHNKIIEIFPDSCYTDHLNIWCGGLVYEGHSYFFNPPPSPNFDIYTWFYPVPNERAYTFWYSGEPKNDDMKNCIALYDLWWFSDKCDKKQCSVCQIDGQ